MNDKQREDRILKFAGFRYSHTATVKNMITGTWGSDREFFTDPDGVVIPTPPIDLNFFDKWVFPKLWYSINKGVMNYIVVEFRIYESVGKYNFSGYYEGYGTLGDALVSALEGLIDGEEGK
jgi:hypothetical protein